MPQQPADPPSILRFLGRNLVTGLRWTHVASGGFGAVTVLLHLKGDAERDDLAVDAAWFDR